MRDSAATPVRADPTLLAAVRRYGPFDATGCYQCGSCTLACVLVTQFASFPRRSLRYVLLGARAPLVASLEPWVCHDCGDCARVCPRQAEPRLSMATLRRFLTAEYDWTGLSAKLLRSRAWYVGSLAAAALATLALILGYHLWYVGLPFRDFATTPFGLSHMFPLMTHYTRVVMLVPLVVLLTHAGRMWWLTMYRGVPERIPFGTYARDAWTYVQHSVAHTLLRQCPDRRRWLGHWLLAFGTVLMLVIKVVDLPWFQTDAVYPWFHPQRWLGYLAAAGILYGLGDIFVGRWKAEREIWKVTRFEDLVFPVLLLLTAVSGLAVHVARYAGFGLTSHLAYAVHVTVATPMLVVEMSFGKWSHMVYRPMALYFQAVRERAWAARPAGEVPYAA
jgi:ferredoxin